MVIQGLVTLGNSLWIALLVRGLRIILFDNIPEILCVSPSRKADNEIDIQPLEKR